MPPIYIIQQGAKIRICKRRLQVERSACDQRPSSEILLQVPLVHISQVVLFGNISLTTPAINTLLGKNIPVIFLTRRGEYRGQLIGSVTPHVPLRRAQYQRLGQPDFILDMAKGFVAAKLSHQRTLLQRQNRKHPAAVLLAAIDQLAASLDAVPRKTSLSSLRGLEGSATRAYFSGYRSLFSLEWRFTARRRRPPPDPVNVLLSFGYTLLAQAVNGAVQAVGLDPYAGFLHEVVYNRPALALDILEEFRPVVDGIALWCCRSGQLKPGDFEPGPAERPVILLEDGKRRFLQAYEKRLEQTSTHPLRGLKLPLRQCLIEQSRQVATRIQKGPACYQGMGFR